MFLKVHRDVAETLNNSFRVALVLVDLSVAFVVTDHTILQGRLEHSVVVTRSTIGWIQSYLSDRSQRVAVGMSI